MASSVASHNSAPHPVFHRAEIDTTAPFESVKEAVTLFGEKVLGGQIYANKINKSPGGEKRISNSKNRELHIIQRELSKAREQLKNAESTKVQALRDLERAKHVVESLTLQLEKANESTAKAAEASEIARKRAEELQAVNANAEVSDGGRGVWQSELDEAREQHRLVLTELDAAKQELRKIKQEHAAALEAQISALKRAESFTALKESNLKKIDELSKEISDANESLILVKVASAEAGREKAAILSEKQAEGQKAAEMLEELNRQILAMKQELDASRDLEAKLAATRAEVECLQKELDVAKTSSQAIVSKANENKSALKEEASRVEAKVQELEEAKANLEKVTEEGNTMKSQLDILRAELEKVRKEVSDLKRKEGEAEAEAATLNAELHKSRSKLASAVAAEAKAKGAASSLSLALQQLASEVEEAKKEAEVMREEANRARSEAEETKAAIKSAETRLEDALREAEVAKAAEAAATAKIKELSERTNAARVSTSESSAEIIMSQEEYDSMYRKVDESNDLAELKVGVAMAHIEAIKAGEQELLIKLDKVNREIEDMRSSEEEALKNAERAFAAKRALEGELQKRREHEERKKAVTFATLPDRHDPEDEASLFAHKHTESLAEVLNLKIPSPDVIKGEHSTELHYHSKKKKPHIPKIGRIFSKAIGKPHGNNSSSQN